MGAVWKRKLAAVGAACLGALCLLGGCLFSPHGESVKTARADSTSVESIISLDIESNNLSYADSTFILYAVSHDGFAREEQPLKMLFWKTPQVDYSFGSQDYIVDEYNVATVNGKDCAVFYSQGISAKQYAELLYARAYVEIDGQEYYSSVSKFGVAEYVHTMREGGGLSDAQNNAFDSLLQYGASVQMLLGYSVDALATRELYKISVNGGLLEDGLDWGRYALKQEFTLNASPAADENLRFSHWVNAAEEIVGFSEKMTLSVSGSDTFTAVYKSKGQVPLTTADFDTMNNGKSSTTYKNPFVSTNGWTTENAMIRFGTEETNYPFLGAEDVAIVLNGNKNTLGTLQSPLLQGGVAKITMNYGIPFGDTKFSLVVDITDSEGNVTTQTVQKTGLAKGSTGEIVLELPTPVLGEVTVKITNGGLSASSSNKDRVAIWNLSVLGAEIVEDADVKLDVHFLELGNYYTGDCTFIKAGDVDILIDAGSRQSSATTISSYINQYCTDGVLEYVVATHAHQDHIAGFVGENNKGIFDLYKVGTLIDFAQSEATTQVYNNYVSKRSALVANGTKHYTALDWWNGVDGLGRSIELASGIFMTVLYQDYYVDDAATENNYSVCLLLSQGDNHYLFTGDLETAGEESLVKNNSLPKVNVYKAGHHGSKTASSAALLAVIQPEMICVCCCCGSDEYSTVNESQYPMQVTVERWAAYTDKIYVTSLAVNDSSGNTVGVTSMNGNIVLSSFGQEIVVQCSNNNTVLKESEWFKANRTWPSGGV
jgi:competence protein ComEC